MKTNINSINFEKDKFDRKVSFLYIFFIITY